jgi:hypothetical protein
MAEGVGQLMETAALLTEIETVLVVTEYFEESFGVNVTERVCAPALSTVLAAGE